MKEVNRETLLEKINYLSAVSKLGLSLNDEYNLATYKMLLTTMEAEPVAYMLECIGGTDYSNHPERGGVPLYRHAQQPVVPEKCPAEIRDLIASHSDALFNDDDAQEIWNACRAAMLNRK